MFGVSSVIDLVSAAASQSPSSLAIVDPTGSVTYEQLIERSDTLASALIDCSVGRDDLVAVCLPRSASFVVATLAILRAGGAYLPIDPGYPEARIQGILSDSGVRVLITSPGLAPVFNESTSVMCIGDGGISSLPQPRTTSRFPRPRDSDLAYAIYTSGSTGGPKGVLVEHASLVNLVEWHQEAFAIKAADRGTQLASPGFDAAVWEIWPYLSAGASIHIPDNDIRSDPHHLRDWLIASQITVGFLPTPLAEEVMSVQWPATVDLRYLLTGGDVLHTRPRSDLPFVLVNNYGVTEAAVVSTSGVISADTTDAQAPTVGWPIRNVSLYVVDDNLDKVPDGSPGELIITGVSVARGYLGRPELTAERFVADPFSADPTSRCYRTGDVVTRQKDGSIRFVGRADDQVKIRGFRVELGEIASVLDRHPAIRSSVATLAPMSTGEKGVVAFVVGVGPLRPGSAELRKDIAVQLPDYMLPVAFVWLDELPRTDHGKIDRSKLSLLDIDELLHLAHMTSPRNETEEVAATVVADLLGLEAVSVDENFFMLGGHSLLGAQLIVRLEDHFGVELTLRTLFDNPTIEALAIEIHRQMATP